MWRGSGEPRVGVCDGRVGTCSLSRRRGYSGGKRGVTSLGTCRGGGYCRCCCYRQATTCCRGGNGRRAGGSGGGDCGGAWRLDGSDWRACMHLLRKWLVRRGGCARADRRSVMYDVLRRERLRLWRRRRQRRTMVGGAFRCDAEGGGVRVRRLDGSDLHGVRRSGWVGASGGGHVGGGVIGGGRRLVE